MTFDQLEAEVFALPKDAQVILLARLLERLGQDSEVDQEVADRWADEAEKRDQVMNTDQSVGIPAEEVLKRVRASLQ